MEVGDINGDGFLDIVGSDNADNEIVVLLGNGDGGFQAAENTSVSFGYQLELGDLNGDGVLDVVNSASASAFGVLLGETTSGVAPLLEFSLATQINARQALPIFQRKLDQLASQRGVLGAFEARINVAAATNRVAVENFAAAGSQISDADVAVEAAKLVRTNILQQAGAAVLAQANQGPALALSLLGGV